MSDFEMNDSHLTILVPGTDWQGYGGWTPSSNGLYACAEAIHGQAGASGCTRLLDWHPSGNNDRDRLAAAEVLRETIAAHQFAPDAKLHLITHSHGGNVALAASHLGLPHPIDILITLSKPQMDAAIYQPGDNIRTFFNISTKGWDWIQYAGSSTKGHYKTDPRAINQLIDTSGSRLKNHAALIWDDQIRAAWWQWFLDQRTVTGQLLTPR